MHRRTLLKAAAILPALAAPRIVRAAGATTLRFVPVIDLSYLDPVYSTAQVTRNHSYMVFDTLYGMDTSLTVHPQMVEGHRVDADEKLWTIALRDGLLWHDGEKVLARDCVASIRRWAKRDALGAALMDATDELDAQDDRTIRFRLKRAFPMLPYALGKGAVNMCAMMPERLAATDPFKQIPEVVGSGPYRYLAGERLSGAHNAYARFDRYKPREGGVTSWTSGPKIAHFERVEWTTMPDLNTGASALMTGEQDWLEIAPHDLMPQLQRNRSLTTAILDPLGYTCALRVNHLQPPFNNPAIRRALLGAIDQAAFMDAVAGTDPQYQHVPLGFFCPGTPMASDAELEIFTAPRDYDRVKRELKAAGYAGETVLLMVPANSLAQKPLGDVAADCMRKAGLNVDYAAMEFGVVQQRQLLKGPVSDGGWSAYVGNWQGMDWLNPIGHVGLRAVGESGYAGWYRSDRMEALRAAWLNAADLTSQQRVAHDIQRLALDEVPYYPIGQYFQPTAYRTSITGVLNGFATFWNVRPA
jgi:peptide/nickel transport system substrate-binding protein